MIRIMISILIPFLLGLVIPLVQCDSKQGPKAPPTQRSLAEDICRNELKDPKAAALNTKLCKLGLEAINYQDGDELDPIGNDKRGNVSPYFAMRYGKRADPYYVMRYGKRADPYYAMRYGKRADPYYVMRYGKRDYASAAAYESNDSDKMNKRGPDPYYAMRYGKRESAKGPRIQSSFDASKEKKKADPYYVMRYG